MNLGLNFKEVFKHLVPVPLRGERFVAWIGSLLQPVQSLNATFADEAEAIRYALKLNGQVIYLEHLLNDVFDPSLRRIYIDDPIDTQVITAYVFNKAEAQSPLYIYNKVEAVNGLAVIYNKGELNNSTDDFIVHVPAADLTATAQVQMRFYINKYRIAGKRYSFQTI